MQSRIKKETWRTKEVYSKINQVLTVDFNSTDTNTIFIYNQGVGTVYVDFNNSVSSNNYEISVEAGSTRSIAIPVLIQSLYIYSNNENKLRIKSFYTENMQPADIPETSIVANVSNDVTLGNIQSIINPLPTGNNTIGVVNLSATDRQKFDTMIQLLTDIKNKP